MLWTSIEIELAKGQLLVKAGIMLNCVRKSLKVHALVTCSFEDENLVWLRIELDAHADVIPVRIRKCADDACCVAIALK
jgi:hypothetical protein